jgi:beta-lactamase class D
MKPHVRLLCGVALSGAIISAAIAAEGKVVSVINTESYTYVEISQNEQNSWIVGPLLVVQPGNQVHFEEGMIMLISTASNSIVPFLK